MNIDTPDNIAGVVLAAGRGERLRPLTDATPKPLLAIGSTTLLAMAIESMPLPASSLAVNACYLADQIEAALDGSGILVRVEASLLGSAGAIANLADWIDGRDVMIRNSDAWFEYPPENLWRGWDGRHPRLLVQERGVPSDFGTKRFLGWSLLPGGLVASLPAGFSGLFDQVWAPAEARGVLELIEYSGLAIDAGTHEDFERLRQIMGGLREY